MNRPPATPLRRPRCAHARVAVGLIALVAALGLSLVGHAEELLLGADANYTYNSNFFSAARNTTDANSFQFGPSLQLNDPDGRFRYELGFIGSYLTYTDQSGVDAWESDARGRATWDLTTRTSVQVTERFRDISNLRFSRQDIALADNALDPTQDRYYRNDLRLELIHDLTQQLEFRLRGEHNWTDFEENIRRHDNQSFTAASELRYQLARRHFVGAGAAYMYQDFDEALTQLGSKAESINAFASWTWLITDTITLVANGGPAWIRSDESDSSQVSQTQFVGGESGGDLFRANINSCDFATGTTVRLASNCDFASFPPLPAADLGPLTSFPLAPGNRVGTDSVVTFFGGVSITANLVDWNLQASYARRQSTTSGAGLASSLDRIAFEVEYAPSRERWSTFVAGAWDRRETLTDSTAIDYIVVDGGSLDAQRETAFTTIRSNDVRRDNYTLIAGYRHRLNENVAATLDGRYRRTEIRDNGPSRPGIDTFFVVLTLEYDYDPINF